MPKVYTACDGTSDTVTRPIVFDVARKIMEWTGIKDVRILFPGKSEEAYQPGSTQDSLSRTQVNLDSQGLIQIQVKETFEKDRLLTAAVFQLDNTCIFKDKALGVYLVPVYTNTDLELEISFRSTDKSTAERWRNEYHQRIATNRAGLIHTVTYNYLIPEEYKTLLRHIHALRENQAGYGQTFDEYIDQHFEKTVNETTTQAGTEARWTVSENQTRVIGHFDFEAGPEESRKNGEGSANEVTFTYQVKYGAPLGVAADYPLLVHNQQIDPIWINTAENYNDPAIDLDIQRAKSTRAIMHFERWNQVVMTKEAGFRFPAYHEFFPVTVADSTIQVASVLIGCNPPADDGSNRNLMNLAELDEDLCLSEDFLKFCKHEHKHLNTYGLSFVCVDVYIDGFPLHNARYHVDEDLNIWLNEEPDLRKTYYVRLSLVTDPYILTNRTRDRMREMGKELNMIAGIVCPNLTEFGMLAKIVSDNYVTRAEAGKLYDRIRKCTKTSFGGLLSDQAPVSWNLVNTLYIVVHRASELK